ncbi:polysaccharide deacetylase family protein [Flexivirga alba]|uniref:Polysaccharide deacetylase family protein n=1 Tax=Flexivirga alba TaxID=702742 RepID=A0ABW2AH33_9MICO
MSIITNGTSPRRRVNVCFHGVGRPRRDLEPGESRYWVSEDDFLRLLDELAEDTNGVSLSVDDGNVSDVEIVLPALLDRGMRATFFVVVDRLGRPGSLTRTDVRQLVASGMTLGNHGWTHEPWTSFDDEELEREVLEARAALSVLTGEAVRTAALPRGQYNRAVLRAARSAGYATLFTSDRQSASADSWLQARFSVHSGVTPESLSRIVRDANRLPRRVGSAMNTLRKSWS